MEEELRTGATVDFFLSKTFVGPIPAPRTLTVVGGMWPRRDAGASSHTSATVLLRVPVRFAAPRDEPRGRNLRGMAIRLRFENCVLYSTPASWLLLQENRP